MAHAKFLWLWQPLRSRISSAHCVYKVVKIRDKCLLNLTVWRKTARLRFGGTEMGRHCGSLKRQRYIVEVDGLKIYATRERQQQLKNVTTSWGKHLNSVGLVLYCMYNI